MTPEIPDRFIKAIEIGDCWLRLEVGEDFVAISTCKYDAPVILTRPVAMALHEALGQALNSGLHRDAARYRFLRNRTTYLGEGVLSCLEGGILDSVEENGRELDEAIDTDMAVRSLTTEPVRPSGWIYIHERLPAPGEYEVAINLPSGPEVLRADYSKDWREPGTGDFLIAEPYAWRPAPTPPPIREMNERSDP